MLPTFHITIPAWGAHYVDTAVHFTVPAVIAALEAAEMDVRCRFHVFTDRPRRFDAVLRDEDVQWHEVPAKGFAGLTKAHCIGLELAEPGAIVLLLNADILVSREAIQNAAEMLSGGTKVLVSTGIRAVLRQEDPPIGADARTLFAWAWRNRHPFMEESVWGRGRTRHPTTLFFERDGSVICRCFHLHPFFVLKDRQIEFRGTVDDDLLARYSPAEFRVLTDREIGFAEMSPAERRFPVGTPLTAEDVIRFGRKFIPAHRRNFTYPIRICGDGPVDDAPWRAIAAGLAGH